VLAVQEATVDRAEAQLRWVLANGRCGRDCSRSPAAPGRVLAARGDTEAPSAMLAGRRPAYAASYAMARGDILLAAGREARPWLAYEAAAAELDPERATADDPAPTSSSTSARQPPAAGTEAG
jgi:predicted negative regulator of RcsB-dependent stress response